MIRASLIGTSGVASMITVSYSFCSSARTSGNSDVSSSPGSPPRWPPVTTSSVSSEVVRITSASGAPFSTSISPGERSSCEQLGDAAAAEVAVDEDGAGSGPRDRDGEPERDRRLAMAPLGARHDDGAEASLGEEEVRAQLAQRLGDAA